MSPVELIKAANKEFTAKENKERDINNKLFAAVVGKLFVSGDDELVLSPEEKRVLGHFFLSISKGMDH